MLHNYIEDDVNIPIILPRGMRDNICMYQTVGFRRRSPPFRGYLRFTLVR